MIQLLPTVIQYCIYCHFIWTTKLQNNLTGPGLDGTASPKPGFIVIALLLTTCSLTLPRSFTSMPMRWSGSTSISVRTLEWTSVPRNTLSRICPVVTDTANQLAKRRRRKRLLSALMIELDPNCTALCANRVTADCVDLANSKRKLLCTGGFLTKLWSAMQVHYACTARVVLVIHIDHNLIINWPSAQHPACCLVICFGSP